MVAVLDQSEGGAHGALHAKVLGGTNPDVSQLTNECRTEIGQPS